MTKRYCGTCGQPVEPSHKFCTWCGEASGKPAPVARPQTATLGSLRSQAPEGFKLVLRRRNGMTYIPKPENDEQLLADYLVSKRIEPDDFEVGYIPAGAKDYAASEASSFQAPGPASIPADVGRTMVGSPSSKHHKDENPKINMGVVAGCFVGLILFLLFLSHFSDLEDRGGRIRMHWLGWAFYYAGGKALLSAFIGCAGGFLTWLLISTRK